MKAGRPRLSARRITVPLLAMLALAGCDRSDPKAGAVVVPTPSAATPSPTPSARPATATTDHIERVPAATLTATPSAVPSAPMQVRKDFTDPPLPAELKDDGGLKPLPPPPPR